MAQSSWYDNGGREGRGEWLSSSSSGADDSESRWRTSAAAAQWGQWWSGWEQPRRAGWWEDNPAWWEHGVELPSALENKALENKYSGNWIGGATFMPVGCGSDALERFLDESLSSEDWWDEWHLGAESALDDWREAEDRFNDDVNPSSGAGNAPVYWWQHQNDVRLCVRPARSRCLY